MTDSPCNEREHVGDYPNETGRVHENLWVNILELTR